MARETERVMPTYRTVEEFSDALEAALSRRLMEHASVGAVVLPSDFTGLFTPDALAYWHQSGKSIEEIVTLVMGPRKASA
jgi:hypothetical protein